MICRYKPKEILKNLKEIMQLAEAIEQLNREMNAPDMTNKENGRKNILPSHSI